MKRHASMMIYIALMLLASLTIPDRPRAEESAVQLLNPVAMVNGFIITPQDLNHEVEQLRWEMDIRNQPLTDRQLDELRPQLIENLIGRELLYQNAQKNNYKIQSQWVDREVAGLRHRLKNDTTLEQYLDQIHMDMAQLKEHLKKGLIIRRMIRRDVLRNVRVSESEMQAFYQRYPDFFRQEEQVRARHILIKVPSGHSEERQEAALTKIQALQAQLEQGAEFSVLALEYSDCPSKNRGGDVGYFTRNQMVTAFSEAAFNLQPGEISDMVVTRYGFHLIQLIDRKPPSQIAYKNTREKIERTLRRNKEQTKIDAYLAGLKRKADIKKY
jgi:parvulin-like peptidyl-prolyl isomerase